MSIVFDFKNVTPSRYVLFCEQDILNLGRDIKKLQTFLNLPILHTSFLVFFFNSELNFK